MRHLARLASDEPGVFHTSVSLLNVTGHTESMFAQDDEWETPMKHQSHTFYWYSSIETTVSTSKCEKIPVVLTILDAFLVPLILFAAVSFHPERL